MLQRQSLVNRFAFWVAVDTILCFYTYDYELFLDIYSIASYTQMMMVNWKLGEGIGKGYYWSRDHQEYLYQLPSNRHLAKHSR